MKAVFLAISILGIGHFSASAWPMMDPVDFEVQLNSATLVVLAKAVKKKDTGRTSKIFRDNENFRLQKITIEVVSTLKGLVQDSNIECQFYRRPTGEEMRSDIRDEKEFRAQMMARLEDETRIIEFPPIEIGAFYLVYLKRESGAYIPVTGLQKPGYSLIELAIPRFISPPSGQKASHPSPDRSESK